MCREKLKGRGWGPTSQSPQATAIPPSVPAGGAGEERAGPGPGPCTALGETSTGSRGVQWHTDSK